ncbi:hypothetical protein SAMN06295955_101890 [Sphingopyxis indica]|uniref:Uncharacterized protein n=1 Tax=Sphingopyxis indica TaxID=436663 RepID=A0A239EQG2_9SPHN|nr:hypothetical protein SAMN06295955_101890 [Sphingopyxis indica]
MVHIVCYGAFSGSANGAVAAKIYFCHVWDAEFYAAGCSVRLTTRFCSYSFAPQFKLMSNLRPKLLIRSYLPAFYRYGGAGLRKNVIAQYGFSRLCWTRHDVYCVASSKRLFDSLLQF